MTQLKVGELAKLTGLTVRTLHHYDEIGLLKPSGRSDAGYRLYAEADVARLHGIQALRHLGLSLADIGGLFEGKGTSPASIIEQQLRGLDMEIARAHELRERLVLIRSKFEQGGEPVVQDWLGALSQMATFGKYFNAGELKTIFTGFERIRGEWTELKADVQGAMDAGTPADAPEVQPLARRWMSLVLSWMGGDFGLIERWDRMYRSEPHAHISHDAPSEAMLAYVRRAVDIRIALYAKHFSTEEMSRMGHVPEAEWAAFDARVAGLVARGERPDSAKAQAALKDWLGLVDRLVKGDRQLRDKIWRANASEPLMAAGSPLRASVRGFLQLALQKSLDPHVA